MPRPTPRRKTDLAFLAVGKIESDLHRTARIQPRARFSGQPRPLEGRRLSERPVSPEKFLPITRERARGLTDVDEGDAVGELGIVKIARQQCAGLEIDLGLHVEQVLWRNSPSTHSQ